ncbi:MAG: septation protein A [Gammaproteobacteria bacterium]|nr:MAG: septation protein A [Gammaproteobacteria bacterium]
MKLLADFFPILLFFVTFKVYGIYAATAAAMAASLAQVSLFWLRHRRFETMHLITFGLIAVLGGATLLFQDETFIKWKPTAVNWAFALAFLGSSVIGRRTVTERIMGTHIALPARVWRRLNLSWVCFFTLLGAANLYVAYRFDTETWVNFKLFGILGLTLLFVLGQGLYLGRHLKET